MVDAGDLKVGFACVTRYEPDGIAGVAELVDATDLNSKITIFNV